jgi:hypothetical protein
VVAATLALLGEQAMPAGAMSRVRPQTWPSRPVGSGPMVEVVSSRS